jgi:PIN like domain
VTFFFDNQMSLHLARAVAELERGSNRHQVTHLRDKFPADIIDPAWIRTLGEDKDWVIVSADLGITKNPANRAAWRESGLNAFFLKGGWQNQEIWIYASRFFWWWPKIVTQAELAQRKGLPDTVQEHAIRGRSAPLTHGDL